MRFAQTEGFITWPSSHYITIIIINIITLFPPLCPLQNLALGSSFFSSAVLSAHIALFLLLRQFGKDLFLFLGRLESFLVLIIEAMPGTTCLSQKIMSVVCKCTTCPRNVSICTKSMIRHCLRARNHTTSGQPEKLGRNSDAQYFLGRVAEEFGNRSFRSTFYIFIICMGTKQKLRLHIRLNFNTFMF